MDIEWVRQYCLSLPHTTETAQWGDHLVFKIGGRIYAIAALEPQDTWLSFKCTPADFLELIERPGIRPAPYLARAQWVALETPEALPPAEVRQFLGRAYDAIRAKLPRKAQQDLARPGKPRRATSAR